MKYIQRTASDAVMTAVHHEVDFPTCCPVTGNPMVGSKLRISYRPHGIVFPVEMLADMLAEYVGGHISGVRGMERTVQDVAQRVAAEINVPCRVRAVLRINPPFGGDPQDMVVSARGVPNPQAMKEPE